LRIIIAGDSLVLSKGDSEVTEGGLLSGKGEEIPQTAFRLEIWSVTNIFLIRAANGVRIDPIGNIVLFGGRQNRKIADNKGDWTIALLNVSFRVSV
jgi:hypothetical protein